MDNTLLKSYKLHFESNNFRKLTKTKASKITDFSFLYKKLTNFISKEHHNRISRWKNMSKVDRSKVNIEKVKKDLKDAKKIAKDVIKQKAKDLYGITL